MDARHSNFSIPRKRLHYISILFMLIIMGALSTSGSLDGIDKAFTDYKFKKLRIAPSSDTVIVAIDTKSLQQLRDWPWSRDVYGEVVTKLDTAGARAIAFDIDFSSHRHPEKDQAFADAIEAASVKVYLASFQQPLSEDYPDIITEMTPYSALRDVASLASVNFLPDQDGYIRKAANGHTYSSWVMPSFATILNGATADLKSFYLDYAINIDQIPVISFVDILNGVVDPDRLRDKVIFIGATAIELGDEYSLPSYGIRSGVNLNALAYETVQQNRQHSIAPYFFQFPLALIIGICLSFIYLRHKFAKYILANFSLFFIGITISLLLQYEVYILLPLTGVWVVQILSMIYISGIELDRRQKKIFSTKMELDQNYNLLRALISEQHEGIITIDHHSKINLINARACTLLGIEKEAAMGQSLWEVCPKMFVPMQATPSDTEGVLDRFELQVPRKNAPDDNETVFLNVTISRVRTLPAKNKYERRKRHRTTVLFAMHDITALKEAEIKERNAKEMIAETLEAKSLLISTLSHELRTPLNAIIGFSQLYKDESFGPLGGEEYLEYAGLINSSGNRLLDVVNDMLMAGRIQSDEITISPQRVSLRDLMVEAEAKAIAKQSNPVQNIQHKLDKDHHVFLDLECIQICLVHLLDNAYKFAGPKADISLEVSHRGDELHMAVKDTGPGSLIEDLDILTELLKQGDNSLNRSHEGCGMGLYLTDQLATLQGGKLELVSSPDGFSATLIFNLQAVMPVQSSAA